MRRDEFVKCEGWKVYRICWSAYQKLSLDVRKEVVQNLKNLINSVEPDYNFVIPAKDSKNFCCDCQKEIHKDSKRCKTCNGKNKRGKDTKITWPSIEKLKKLLSENSCAAVGRMLDISDNVIRKHMKKYG